LSKVPLKSGDGGVRQLADVFRRDRLDDRIGILLDRDRRLDAAADAGHGHLADRVTVGVQCRYRILRVDVGAQHRQEYGAAGRDRTEFEHGLAVPFALQNLHISPSM
jgi:hypothetical protein